MTEHELLEQCRAGDPQARHEFYTATADRVYRLLLRMTGNADDAFDLAQETYLKAFAAIDRFDGRATFATWLYRIAVNEALQFLRSARQEVARQRDQALDDQLDDATDVVAIRLDMGGALAALSSEDRAILLLRYQEDLDYRAIAEALGCPGGTVASRLNRARERLRAKLAPGYESREERGVVRHPK